MRFSPAPAVAVFALRLSVLASVSSCGSAPFAPVPPVTSAAPSPSTSVLTSNGPAPPDGPVPAGYTGLGPESLSAETLEKYKPRALRREVSERISSLIDVRAPGIGQLGAGGKALYFGWTITGVGQVWRTDGPRRFPQQLTAGDEVTTLAAITPNGRTLVVQRDRDGEENPGLYLQPAEGGELAPIAHTKGVQTHFELASDDSRYVYFTSNERARDAYVVYRWNIARGEREVVFDRVPGLWHVGDARPGGALLLRKETGSLTAEYYEWDPAKGELKPLLGVGESEEIEARYGPKDGELIVLTNRSGNFRRLYSVVASTWTPLGSAVSFDVDAFDIDRKRTRILYTTNEAGYGKLHALDARSGAPIALPADLPEADRVTFGPTTPDGRLTTLGVDDGKRPLQTYVLDWAAGRLESWSLPSTPEIDTTKFARAKLETYPARDGTPIPVFVRTPNTCAEAPCPVVVSFHGGPEGQARPGFSVGAQMFVDAGFVFVEPNVRGSDGYGKAWSHADDGPRRLGILTDIEDAATWARARFAAAGKPPKVGIYGGSYGGYSVLIGMTMFAGSYDAGVDVVGISDLRTFLKNTAPYRRVLRISEYGDPDRDAEALRKLSPMTYVDRIKAPLLILQGAKDPRVPAGEAVQIHDAAAAKGVAADLMIFPDEGHGAQKRANRVLMLGHAIAFLKEHLK